jgi:hypothetical protein
MMSRANIKVKGGKSSKESIWKFKAENEVNGQYIGWVSKMKSKINMMKVRGQK